MTLEQTLNELQTEHERLRHLIAELTQQDRLARKRITILSRAVKTVENVQREMTSQGDSREDIRTVLRDDEYTHVKRSFDRE